MVEEPLEIRLSWIDADGTRTVEPLAVTMRTPGDDFELVAGFLHGEGVVSSADDLVELTYCRGDRAQEYNTVEARLRPGVAFDLERTRRNFYATSSCGVCGKASLDAVTGGLHAAGLFGRERACFGVREDVGRHNAVDKVLGAALLERRLPASEAVLVVSGRASFELVQKALMAGVPMLVAVGAPSTLAVDLARQFGQTLVGFARDGGCNVYTAEERVV